MLMLPDFPRQKATLGRIFESTVRAAAQAANPWLSGMPQFVLHEGGGEGLQQLSAKLSISDDECRHLPLEAVLEKACAMGADLGRQQGRIAVDKMVELAQEAGTTLDGQGRPFGPDVVLELLAKISIEFGENGEPVMPLGIVGPAIGERIRQNAAQWESDPTVRARLRQVIQRKREEWLAREARRRLVD